MNTSSDGWRRKERGFERFNVGVHRFSIGVDRFPTVLDRCLEGLIGFDGYGFVLA